MKELSNAHKNRRTTASAFLFFMKIASKDSFLSTMRHLFHKNGENSVPFWPSIFERGKKA